MTFYPTSFINLFFRFFSILSPFIFERVLFLCPVRRGPNLWQVYSNLRLCLPGKQRVLQAVGAEFSFQPWSHWSQSVVWIVHSHWRDQRSAVTPTPLYLKNCNWLKVSGRQGHVSVQSISIPFIFLSFGGSCCFIPFSQETCIKLY